VPQRPDLPEPKLDFPEPPRKCLIVLSCPADALWRTALLRLEVADLNRAPKNFSIVAAFILGVRWYPASHLRSRLAVSGLLRRPCRREAVMKGDGRQSNGRPLGQ
jgi:hypothetical protein